MRDNKPSRVILLISAMKNASVTPAHSDTTMVSSVATLVTCPPLNQLRSWA